MTTRPKLFDRLVQGAFADCDAAALAGLEFAQLIKPGALEKEGIVTVEQIATFAAVAAVTAIEIAFMESSLVPEGDGDTANALFSQAIAMLPPRIHATATDISNPTVCDRVNAYRAVRGRRFDA